MENKINILELLKDCPEGMKLDCTLFENLEFDHTTEYNSSHPIVCRVKTKLGGYDIYTFTEYGCYSKEKYAKCVIFPKGKTTWEGFQRPFKDGDIVFYNDTISIFKEWGDETLFRTYVCIYLSCEWFIDKNIPLFGKSIRKEIRLATEGEKQKLFNAIKANGYKWNDKTKTLEQLIVQNFEDGDIVFYNNYVGIFKKWIDETTFRNYVDVNINGKLSVLCHNTNNFGKDITIETRLATKEEKQKLFDVIKKNGYKWNAEKKELTKIKPEFHEGDWVTDGVSKCQICFIDGTQYWYAENCILGSIESVDKQYHLWTINDAKDGDVIFYDDGWICIFKCIHGIWYSSYCFITEDGEFHTGYETHAVDTTINGNAHPATKEQRNLLFQKIKEAGYKWNAKTKTLEKLTKPKFKVGDRIKHKNNCYAKYIIKEVYDSCYKTNCGTMPFELQDDYELIPNKFDINTLKPFDKVLVRCTDDGSWSPQFFAKYRPGSKFPFVCTYNTWSQCIPYEGNEHLSDTTEDCNEYYKTW